MAVAMKNRRRIIINQRQFVWYVVDDEDSSDMILRVVSEDKKFIVRYHLGQPEEIRLLIILGREFRGLTEAGGCWLRVLCPQWEQNGAVTPGCVHRLVDWCLNQDRDLVQVDYRGKPIEIERNLTP